LTFNVIVALAVLSLAGRALLESRGARSKRAHFGGPIADAKEPDRAKPAVDGLKGAQAGAGKAEEGDRELRAPIAGGGGRGAAVNACTCKAGDPLCTCCGVGLSDGGASPVGSVHSPAPGFKDLPF
jgi:hypothetical protein